MKNLQLLFLEVGLNFLELTSLAFCSFIDFTTFLVGSPFRLIDYMMPFNSFYFEYWPFKRRRACQLTPPLYGLPALIGLLCWGMELVERWNPNPRVTVSLGKECLSRSEKTFVLQPLFWAFHFIKRWSLDRGWNLPITKKVLFIGSPFELESLIGIVGKQVNKGLLSFYFTLRRITENNK